MFGSCVGGNSHMYTQTSKYNVGHITTHTIFSASITVQTLAHSHINPHTHTTLQAISPYSVLVSVLCVGYTCCHGNNNTLACRPLTHYIQCQNQSMYGGLWGTLVAMATATVMYLFNSKFVDSVFWYVRLVLCVTSLSLDIGLTCYL